MKRYVVGDIHGNYFALKECLNKCDFDYNKDMLIVLGDIVDGHYYTKDVIDELLKIKNCVLIEGNHDSWFKQFISNGFKNNIWLHQGGANTLYSYDNKVPVTQLEKGWFVDDSVVNLDFVNVPITHQDFLNKALPYYILDDMVFVHGGFDYTKPIQQQSLKYITWDRSLVEYAQSKPIIRNDGIKGYWKKIFVGHTTTQSWHTTQPIKHNNLWMLDTGAGYDGKLTIMNIDTEEYWQSKKFKGHEI